MSNNQLTAEQREYIRGFMYQIVLPIGGAISLILGFLGYSLHDYSVSEAVRQAQTEYMKTLADITKESAETQAKADRVLEDLNKKQKEVETIRTKMKALQEDANALANNESFARKVAHYVDTENTFRWRKLEYRKSSRGFSNNCVYVLRENHYMEPGGEEGTFYGPDMRTSYLAFAASNRELRFVDKDNKPQRLSYFDLRTKQTHQSIYVSPDYVAFEGCFTFDKIVFLKPIRVDKAE